MSWVFSLELSSFFSCPMYPSGRLARYRRDIEEHDNNYDDGGGGEESE